MDVHFFHINILSFIVFIIVIVHVLLDFTTKQSNIQGVFRVCCKCMWFMIFIERCTTPHSLKDHELATYVLSTTNKMELVPNKSTRIRNQRTQNKVH